MRPLLLIVYCCLCAACSDRAATPAAQQQQSLTSEPVSAAREDSGDVSRAKLTTGGIPSSSVAHFENKQIVRIDEERKPQGGATLRGEYTFSGGRLMRYQGAKTGAPATLDLQFDLSGGLQSGRGPDLSDADIDAIRTRAHLLRSHALAHRDVSGH